MEGYQNVFGELRYEVAKVAFLNSFLNGAIVFFVMNVLATVLHISFWYSLVPATIVLIIGTVYTLSRYSLKRLEDGNPEVREMLRTAHDNKGKDSLLVHALFVDLLEKMDTVSAGVFINAGKTVIKLVVIAALAFTPLLIVNYVPGLMLNQPLSNLGLGVSGAARSALAPILPIEDAGERNLSGERDIIALGDDKLDITAASSQGGVDFGNPDEAYGKQFRYNDYPDAVVAEQSEAGTGGALDEADLINDYSCRVKGTCPK